uniref:UCH catalytic domain-containing protein n=1 Tax=Zea mays TaxID=4577 RepID=A0A804R229_MAIZE
MSMFCFVLGAEMENQRALKGIIPAKRMLFRAMAATSVATDEIATAGKDDPNVVAIHMRKGDASYPSEQLLISGEKETQDQIYFIKQIESLGNACGTIALLHAVGNASSKVNLVENSCLDLFFKSTATMDDPHERAVCLEKDDTMARAHLLAANDGATEGMSPDVATAPKSKGCLMIGEYNKVAKK